jgi:hypothetical protein
MYFVHLMKLTSIQISCQLEVKLFEPSNVVTMVLLDPGSRNIYV